MASTLIKTFPRGAKTALATVTNPSQGIYLLSMHNAGDNRLTPDFIKHALLPALDDIELTFRKDYAKGNKEAALVLTGERDKYKFFSNGLNLELVNECPGFFKDYYYVLLSRLLTFPMHTVSALAGHTFAGGLCLALATDWRVVRKERVWMCMNENDFGAPLPVGMASVLKQRLPPPTLRTVMLSAHRFVAEEALKAGIVDEIVDGDGEATVKRALEVAEREKRHSASGSLSMIKQTIYSGVLTALQTEEIVGSPFDQNASRFKQLQEAAVAAKL